MAPRPRQLHIVLDSSTPAGSTSTACFELGARIACELLAQLEAHDRFRLRLVDRNLYPLCRSPLAPTDELVGLVRTLFEHLRPGELDACVLGHAVGGALTGTLDEERTNLVAVLTDGRRILDPLDDLRKDMALRVRASGSRAAFVALGDADVTALRGLASACDGATVFEAGPNDPASTRDVLDALSDWMDSPPGERDDEAWDALEATPRSLRGDFLYLVPHLIHDGAFEYHLSQRVDFESVAERARAREQALTARLQELDDADAPPRLADAARQYALALIRGDGIRDGDLERPAELDAVAEISREEVRQRLATSLPEIDASDNPKRRVEAWLRDRIDTLTTLRDRLALAPLLAATMQLHAALLRRRRWTTATETRELIRHGELVRTGRVVSTERRLTPEELSHRFSRRAGVLEDSARAIEREHRDIARLPSLRRRVRFALDLAEAQRDRLEALPSDADVGELERWSSDTHAAIVHKHVRELLRVDTRAVFRASSVPIDGAESFLDACADLREALDARLDLENAEHERARKQLEDFEADRALWEKRGKLAVRSGRDDLARAALEQKRKFEALLDEARVLVERAAVDVSMWQKIRRALRRRVETVERRVEVGSRGHLG